MLKLIRIMRFSLVSKLIVSVGLVLLLIISTWSYFAIRYQNPGAAFHSDTGWQSKTRWI